MCEREKKINSFQITVTIFKACKKCKAPIQKGFLKWRTSKQNILSALLYIAHPKIGEGKS